MNDFILALMGHPALNAAAAATLLLAAIGLGGGALRLLAPKHRPAPTAALALGLAMLAWLALVAAPLLLRAPRRAVWLVMLPAAAGGLLHLLRTGAGMWLRQNRAAALAALALIAWFGGSTLLPPFSWDEQTYQLALPVHWLAEGSVRPTADVPYSGFPLLPQFPVLILLKMGGLATARMLILLLFAALFLTLFDELRRRLEGWAAWLLAAVFILSPLVLAMIREFYAEVFLALPLLAALQLRRALPKDLAAARRGLIFGTLAGAAAAVKLTGAGVSLAILLTALPSGAFRRGRPHRLPGTLGGFLAAAVLAAAPFYLRPYLALGNPCYPFLSAVFGTPSPAIEAYHRAMGDFRYGLDLGPGIAYSWLFTAFYGDIYDGILTGWPFTLCCVGGVALGYLAWRRRRRLRSGHLLLGAVVLLLYLFWCATAQQTRFLLPLYPVLMIFAAEGLRGRGRRVRLAALALMVAGGVLSFDWPAFRHGWYSWLLADQSLTRPAEVLARAMRGPHMVNGYDHLLEHTPPDARVLLLFDRRSLYCPRISRNGTPGFQEWIDWGTDPDADPMPALRQHRIDCLLLNSLERNPDQLEMARSRDIALAEQLRGALKRGELVMEEIPDLPAPAAEESTDGPALLLLRVADRPL